MSHSGAKIVLPYISEDKVEHLRVRVLQLLRFAVFVEPARITAAGTTALNLIPSLIICDATLGNQTLELPHAADGLGVVYFVKKIDATANTVTIAADGSDLIEGASTQVLTSQWACVTIVGDGLAWYNI